MSGLREALAGRVAELGYATAWAALRYVPEPVAAAAFTAGADLTTSGGVTGVRTLRANLARVVPEASATELNILVRDAMRSYARYWREAFRLPAMDPVAVHDRMASHTHGMHGPGSPLEALAAGRPVVLALPHSGNWDVAGLYLVEELRRLGRPPVMTTVVERLSPESLFRRFVAFRESLGFEVVPEDAGRAAHRVLTARLRAGGAVCLVADRDLGGNGVTVPFFGRPTRLPSGPAALAALTGAQLHAVCPTFVGPDWGVRVTPALPVGPGHDGIAKATLLIAQAFEELIARNPADWHMLQELTPGEPG